MNYKGFPIICNDKFRVKLDKKIFKHDINNTEYHHFFNIFIIVLNKRVPMKRKYLRPNQARFTTKNLDKAIMKLSRPRNTFCAIGNVSEIM